MCVCVCVCVCVCSDSLGLWGEGGREGGGVKVIELLGETMCASL